MAVFLSSASVFSFVSHKYTSLNKHTILDKHTSLERNPKITNQYGFIVPAPGSQYNKNFMVVINSFEVDTDFVASVSIQVNVFVTGNRKDTLKPVNFL